MVKSLFILIAVFSTVFSFNYEEFQRKHCYEAKDVRTTAFYFPYEIEWHKFLPGYVCENFVLTKEDLTSMSEMSFSFSSEHIVFLRNCKIDYFNEILVSKFTDLRRLFFDNCTLSLKNPENNRKPTISNNLWTLGFHNCQITDNLKSRSLQEFVKLAHILIQNTTFECPEIDEYFLPKKHDLDEISIDNSNIKKIHKGILSTAHYFSYIYCTSCQLDEVDSLFYQMNDDVEYFISFANNNITKLPSSKDIFAKITSLLTLDLSNNIITEPALTKDHFETLTNLNNLDLSRNTKISSINKLAFVDTALEYLNMSNVNLEFLEKLGNSKLISIDFSYNKISDIGLDVFEDLSNLKYLNLSFNSISNLQEPVFNSLGNLTELRLNSNQLKELPKDLFKHLTHLEILDLSCNPIITTDGFKNKSPFKELTHIIIADTNGCNCTLLSSNGLFANNTETHEIVNAEGVLRNGNTYVYQCPHKHILLGAQRDICIHGELTSNWYKNPPSCSKYCTKNVLKRTSTRATCKYKTAVIDCNDDNILPGTTAEFQCQTGYVKPVVQMNSITCLNSGEWDSLPYPCSPVCGRVSAPQTKFIYGGYETNITNVPWQAAIYKKNAAGSYEHICGGSIVTAKLIVTAAHCLWDRTLHQQIESSLFNVAVGKTRRDYYMEDTDYSPQFSNISEYHIGRYFASDSLSFLNDIAVLILSETIIFKKFIVPICWDRGSRFKDVVSNLEGKIAGWGRDETGKPSATLKFIRLQSISNSDCQNRVSHDYKSSIVADKFCVSSDEQGNSLCDGDSGGGFAVERDNHQYFLEGVVSTGLKLPQQGCEGNFYVTLTSFNHHIDFISELEQKYRVY